MRPLAGEGVHLLLPVVGLAHQLARQPAADRRHRHHRPLRDVALVRPEPAHPGDPQPVAEPVDQVTEVHVAGLAHGLEPVFPRRPVGDLGRGERKRLEAEP